MTDNRLNVLLLMPLFLCSLISVEVKSQVTIGSTLPPNKGSLLDLKENSNKNENASRGLLLPRVALESAYMMGPILNDDIIQDAEKMNHIGLTVFNMTDNYLVDLCKGVYVWDYTEWVRLSEPCCFPLQDVVISYPPSFNFQENEEVELHAFIADPFLLDDPNIRYKWYIGDNEATDVEIPNTDGDNIILLTVGMEYDGKQISVKAFNNCSEISSERHTMSVAVACRAIQDVKIKSYPDRSDFRYGVDKEVTFYAEILGDPTIYDFEYKWEWTINGVKKESDKEYITEVMTSAHNNIELKLTVSNGCPSSKTATQILSVYTCPEEKQKFNVSPNTDMSRIYTLAVNDLIGYTKEELAELGITIQWYKKQNKMSGPMSEWITDKNFVPIPGANDPQYIFNTEEYLGSNQDICDIGVKVTGSVEKLTDCPIHNGYSYYRIMAQSDGGNFQAKKPEFKTSSTPW